MFLNKRNKTWYLHYKDSTSKWQKVSTKTSNKTLAEHFKRNFQKTLGDIPEHECVIDKSLNLLHFKERIIDYAKLNYTSANVELYERSLRYFIKITGNKLLEDITVLDIEKYKAKRAEAVSRTTVNIELRSIKAMFNVAVLRWEIINKNPVIKVQQFLVPEKEILALSDEEIKRLIEAIEDLSFKKIVLFALYTGCRASEIINLEWSDIDFDSRTITIKNKPTFKTKTGKIRQIPINDSLYKLLTENTSNIYNLNEIVFTHANGIKYRRDFLTYKFKYYIHKAGLPHKFHFHCTRHTFITKLIKSNVSINKVMKLAGHSEITTTLGYTHILVDDLRDAVKVINY